ncbi:MAG: hypothetical protein IKE28_12045 [Solobacterium sp.]|nr:hypothetical protein [Solobacterium sp.]
MKTTEDSGMDLFGQNLWMAAGKEPECVWIITRDNPEPGKQVEFRVRGTEEDAKIAAKGLKGHYRKAGPNE